MTLSVPNLSERLLDSYFAENISAICPQKYWNNKHNHCAHFVAHVMSVHVGTITCKGMVGKRGKGACIKVDALFRVCPEVGRFSDVGSRASSGVFIFVTLPSAVSIKTKTIAGVENRHVGICFGDTVWHYNNKIDRVVTDTPADFRNHYPSQRSELYFGTFPATAVPLTLQALASAA